MTAAEKVRRLRKTVDSGQTCAILVNADPDSPSFKGSPPRETNLAIAVIRTYRGDGLCP